jgi:hypothetical protein
VADRWWLIIIEWMFNFARHKLVRDLLEGSQASIGTEIYPLASIFGIGIFGRVLYVATAGSFELRGIWFNHGCHYR